MIHCIRSIILMSSSTRTRFFSILVFVGSSFRHLHLDLSLSRKQCSMHLLRDLLLVSVAAASVRVLRRLHIAVRFNVLAGRLAEDVFDGTVLVALTDPVFQVTVEFASRNTALPAVNLALDSHLLNGVLCGDSTLRTVKKRAGSSPCPLPVVGACVSAGKRDGSIHAAVNVVKV